MQTEEITFEGTDGRLAARLDLPVGKPLTYALFAHCFTCTKDIFAASRISETLTGLGIATLRFDFTGLGESDGDFANTNFTSNIQDLLKAAEFLAENYQAPSLLVGHSLGGAAVLAAAVELPDVKAVATIGAPFDPAHAGQHFLDQHAEIRASDTAVEVNIGGRPFRVKRQFLDDIDNFAQTDRLKKLKKALLILHAPLDQIVGINNATNIFVAARHPKSFLSLDRADHLLRRSADAAYAAEMIGSWARRYIPTLMETEPKTGLTGEATDTFVIEAGDGFRQHISAAGHRLTADEPFAMGGTNRGPNPYDLLLSGLGACTSMTIRMYANRKKWPLRHVSVRLSHAKIHAEDCADCDTKEGKIDHIEREIELIGDLDDEMRARLLEIADRCPVHRTLHSEVKISTRLT
ncbi:MAG: osmotically inducible protein C [Sneathiella sp.]|jgi:putative redox protein|uniref:bifunctional alpha/beta hydrolase/OsmC family protein n=1 Tax=Sneathiella sp. TaxID=1964365 RepID=UPI000C566AC1|nr:alpha/beta fold hydrolase [Sneathiella sp.]MAL80260.1 osmotically inducible protein C [Sneathiella sp.]